MIMMLLIANVRFRIKLTLFGILAEEFHTPNFWYGTELEILLRNLNTEARKRDFDLMIIIEAKLRR